MERASGTAASCQFHTVTDTHPPLPVCVRAKEYSARAGDREGKRRGRWSLCEREKETGSASAIGRKRQHPRPWRAAPAWTAQADSATRR
ncbi:hypothetical protein OJAV_G00203500 [Oryzias javanicus]|uniref:Uncharacterized protein n=1 Tax=Oryzias javanicus TaxID=123683 RepID=A0A3S2P5K6_ORYJA|nr:hypothetical protein OJAV_G00203500 [Oryzias javanicus]